MARPVRKTQVLACQTVKNLSYEHIRIAVTTMINTGGGLSWSDREYLLNRYPDLKEELISRVG